MKRALPLLLLLLVLLCAAPARADDELPATLAAALAQARESGALERVLGEHHFRDPRGGLVTSKVELDEEAGTLRCEVLFASVGAMRQETLELWTELGLDGRVRRLGFELVRGRHEARGEGEREHGRLALRLTETVEGLETGTTRELDWPDDALPFEVAVFLLPLLREHLPGRLELRIYHGVEQRVTETPSALSSEGAVFRLAPLYGSQDGEVELSEDGFAEVRLGPGEVLLPISAEEAAKLSE